MFYQAVVGNARFSACVCCSEVQHDKETQQEAKNVIGLKIDPLDVLGLWGITIQFPLWSTGAFDHHL